MNKMNIVISCDPRYKVNREALRFRVSSVLQQHKVSGKVEVGVNIVGDRKIANLNQKYRGIKEPADILTFALEDLYLSTTPTNPKLGFVAAPDRILRLGDIVISYPQAVMAAAEDGLSVDEEINFLIEHGTKHLLGIHHD